MGVAYSPKIITDNLVFHVDFADRKCYSGSGSTCKDLSGINGNGTLSNVTYTSDRAFLMNAFNSTITFSRSYTNISNKHTFFVGAFCPNLNSQDFCALISSINFDTLAGWNLNFNSLNGQARSDFFSEDGIISSVEFVANSNRNQNYVLAGTIDDNIFKFYLNGVLISSQTLAMTINSDSLIELGYNTQGPYNTAPNAKIYKALIYNRPLSDKEIRQNYNALKGRLKL